jgi:trimethylamine:corrinoid methyltransferase-like protein
MGAVGGSIESVSIKGRGFAVAADADASRKLGGFENENQMNGNGTTRTVKTRVGWMVSGLSLSLDDTMGDQEFLQEIADGLEQVPISVTLASGAIYSATGTITGEISGSTQSATGEIELSGGGKLEKQ